MDQSQPNEWGIGAGGQGIGGGGEGIGLCFVDDTPKFDLVAEWPNLCAPKSCMPISPAVPINSKSSSSSGIKENTERPSAKRICCSIADEPMSFIIRASLSERKTASDEALVFVVNDKTNSGMLITTTNPSKMLNQSSVYSLNPSPTSFIPISPMNSIVKTWFATVCNSCSHRGMLSTSMSPRKNRAHASGWWGLLRIKSRSSHSRRLHSVLFRSTLRAAQ